MTRLTVTTAEPLSEERKTALEKEFATKYGEIKVNYVVDDAIIGGIIIFDGNEVFDGSVSGRLSSLEEAVKGKLQ